jgi:translation initiation factor 2-alpha kinase 4
MKTALPLYGVDLEPRLLSKLTLNSNWLTDEEAWRGILAELSTGERKYADVVREGVKEGIAGDKERCAGVWLYSVREARVSGIHLGPDLNTD